MSKEEIMMSKKIIEYFDGLIKIETDAKEKFKHSPNIQEAADSSIKTLEGCKDTMLYILSQFKQDEQSERIKELEGDIKYITETYADLMSELSDKIKQLEANKQSDAVEFAEWTAIEGWEYFNDGLWSNFLVSDNMLTTQELYTLFKDEQLKKK
jgi:hypothetical protein